jgi:hypothetical protein
MPASPCCRRARVFIRPVAIAELEDKADFRQPMLVERIESLDVIETLVFDSGRG